VNLVIWTIRVETTCLTRMAGLPLQSLLSKFWRNFRDKMILSEHLIRRKTVQNQ
jgi:hypothetical protein